MPSKVRVKSGIEAVRRIEHISTNVNRGCAHCEELVNSIEDFRGAVHHYMEHHGYRLLHVGSETRPDGPHGEPCSYTVAVLGSDNPPPVRPPATGPLIIFPEDRKK